MEPIAVILNGASSAGKTSIAKAMQQIWPSPLIHASLDSFTDVFDWTAIEQDEVRDRCHQFGINTFHDYLVSVAECPFSVVVDHVFEQRAWYENTRNALKQKPMLFVAIQCDLTVLEARERERGNRRIGLSRSQHQRVHDDIDYDLEVDTTNQSPMACAKLIMKLAQETYAKRSPNRADLPSPPNRFQFADIELRFERITPGDLARGFSPGYHFRILDSSGNDAGHLNFRVGDSAHVRLAAGQLGFEIKEPFRGRGYASKACQAIEPWLAENWSTILITADPDNLPSLQTIKRIGAVYRDEVEVPLDDPHFARGSRRKKRFDWAPKRQPPTMT